MNKKEIIKKLELFADLLEFHGANKFKVSAFKNGANILRRFSGDLMQLIADKNLESVKGIGKGIASFVYEYARRNGKIAELDDLLGKTPKGILDILAIRGLGVKKAKQIYQTLYIDNIDDLALSCKDGRLEELKGFSTKSVKRILLEIDNIKVNRSKLHLHRALDLAEEIKSFLKESLLFILIENTGELRRIREVIANIEFVGLLNYEADSKDKICNYLENNKIEYFASDGIIELKSYGIPVTLYLSESENQFSDLLEVRSYAPGFISKALEKRSKGQDSLSFNSIIPEMREHLYFELPEELRTNSDLEFEDFKGLFHFHTTYSDGMNSPEEMCNAAVKFGFQYAVVCDHSKSAYYANGLTEERILEQKNHVERINKSLKITFYQGIESDILSDGSLDYPDEILSKFSLIIASVHSNFTMKKEEMTNRIIKAVENPFTDILGHPTGRLLLSRDSYNLDIKKVIDACSANDVAIEINANPHRLDLDWRNIYYAREKGVRFSINADAHSTEEIGFTKFGVLIARKAGVKRKEVINCFGLREFNKFINRKVKRE